MSLQSCTSPALLSSSCSTLRQDRTELSAGRSCRGRAPCRITPTFLTGLLDAGLARRAGAWLDRDRSGACTTGWGHAPSGTAGHTPGYPSTERPWLNPRLCPSRRLGCRGTALRHCETTAGASPLPAGPAGVRGRAEARQPPARTGSSLRVGQGLVTLGMSRSQHGAAVCLQPTPRSR